jgi:small GTP-binding protein
MKIAIIGLSNAGKTSLLRIITNQFSTIDKLRPTIGINYKNISFFGKEISFWDFGGQVFYKNNYLNNPRKYFSSLDVLYYVIDIQDKGVFNENFEYFNDIYNIILKYSSNCKISILFNKADPNYSSKISLDYKLRFMEVVKDLNSDDNFTIKSYLTSIYSPMSVFTAISESLFDKNNMYKDLSKFLENFCFDFNIEFAIILSTILFEFGKYISDNIKESDIEDFLHSYFIKFKDFDEDLGVDLFFQEIQLKHTKFKVKIDKKSEDFFLLIGYKPEITLLKDDNLSKYLDEIGLDLEKYISASLFS